MKVVIQILILLITCYQVNSQTVLNKKSGIIKICESYTEFGDINICLPKLDGMTECYSNPMVNKRVNKANKSILILAYYLSNSIKLTELDETTFNELNFKEYIQIYSNEKLKGVKADAEILNSAADYLESNSYYKGENWDEVLKKAVEMNYDISISRPILIESYTPLKNCRTHVLLSKIQTDFEEIIKISVSNLLILNDRMINMCYINEYNGPESIKKAKSKNDYILYQLQDENSGKNTSSLKPLALSKPYESNDNNLSDYIKYYNAGISQTQSNNYIGAIEEYTKAIKINPNYDAAYVNRGNAKAALKNYSGAIDDYSIVIKNNPNFLDIYYNRGIARRNLNDFKGAITDYTKAIQINPSNSKIYYNRGISKRNLNDLAGAIADYTKAIQLKPDYAKAYYNRGFVKNIMNDKKGMCNDYKKACEMGFDEGCKYFSIECN